VDLLSSQIEQQAIVAREKLKLQKTNSLFYKDYLRKIQYVLDQKNKLLNDMLPYFVLEQDIHLVFHVERFYRSIKRNDEIEHLLKLWKSGYRHPDLVILLALYYGHDEKHIHKIIEFLNFPEINKEDKILL